jgi:hypothetical protein
MLLGKDLGSFQAGTEDQNGHIYLILSPLHSSEDFRKYLPQPNLDLPFQTMCQNYLQPGHFSGKTFVFDNSNITLLDIGEETCSEVENLQQRLVEKDVNGKWGTWMTHLRGQDFYRMACKSPQPLESLNSFRVITKHIRPTASNPIQYICLDYECPFYEAFIDETVMD